MTKILIAGDYCPNARVSELIENEKYSEIFEEIKMLTNLSDYAILNFECPVVLDEAKPIKKNGPNLKCTTKSVAALKYAGFDMVTLANNHFYDYGDVGVKDTLNTCQKYDIDTIGGGDHLKQAQEINYKKIKDNKVAFINVCEHEFSIATESSGGSNPLNPIANYYQIKEAKNNSDYVIVIVHGGHEYYQLPSPRMKETYRFFIDAGADAVINHHQHCYSGYEVYNGKPIFYGLGNFCFDWEGKQNSQWNQGYMVSLSFNANNVSFDLHPYIQCDEIAGVIMMNEKQKEVFFHIIERLNCIIEDDIQLNSERNKWMKQNQIGYKIALEPYQNRYLTGLYVRHLLPSFLTKKKLMNMLNLLECESHIERMIHLIKTELNRK